MLIGYARTSALEQEAGLEAQMRDLEALGCDRIFAEQTSSVAARKALEEAIEYTRAGDTLVATKLDRLARNVPHMWEVIQRLEAKGVALRHRQHGNRHQHPDREALCSTSSVASHSSSAR